MTYEDNSLYRLDIELHILPHGHGRGVSDVCREEDISVIDAEVNMTTYLIVAVTRDIAGAAWVCSCLCLAVGVMFIMWWWMDRNDKLQGG